MKMFLANLCLLLALFSNEGSARLNEVHQRQERANMRSLRDLTKSRQGNEAVLYGPRDNFYQAESLDFFKNISPDWFEWINPDEIQAGATTCGYLYPDLGLLPHVTYPRITVYVCVRFADIQPAAKGNMFVHCGGPGSLSDCTDSMIRGGYFSQKNLNEYNILSVDQRGMGRSYPTFAHEECSNYRFTRNETDGSIAGLAYREEDYALFNTTGLDDEDIIKLQLQKYKSRVFECWSVDEFQMSATQVDGTVRDFHFLDYSGTRHLAQDIWLMQLLSNAPKMHLYGISYGTSVFSTFATIFPGLVGLMVLDSTTSPNPDAYHQALTKAVGLHDRINYIVYSCTAQNFKEPGSCPVTDLRKCLGDINAMVGDMGVDIGDGDGLGIIQEAILFMFNTGRDRAEELCSFAGAGDIDAYIALIREVLLEEEETPEDDETVVASKEWLVASGPTSEYQVYGNPEYSVIVTDGRIPIYMVRAQDRTGAVYDEDFFAKEVLAVKRRYTGAGTGAPGNTFFAEYAVSFYWPSSVPLPPGGSPYVEGIIVGLMYDSHTPYIWAQEMRRAFPSTNLLTSKATNHGLGGDDYECQQSVAEHLESGDVAFVDGAVCGDDSDSFLTDFVDIFFESTEGGGFAARPDGEFPSDGTVAPNGTLPPNITLSPSQTSFPGDPEPPSAPPKVQMDETNSPTPGVTERPSSAAPTEQGSAPNTNEMLYVGLKYKFTDDAELQQPTVEEVSELLCITMRFFEDRILADTGEMVQSHTAYAEPRYVEGDVYPIQLLFFYYATHVGSTDVVSQNIISDALQFSPVQLEGYTENCVLNLNGSHEISVSQDSIFNDVLALSVGVSTEVAPQEGSKMLLACGRSGSLNDVPISSPAPAVASSSSAPDLLTDSGTDMLLSSPAPTMAPNPVASESSDAQSVTPSLCVATAQLSLLLLARMLLMMP